MFEFVKANQHWFSVGGLALDLIGVILIIFMGTYYSKDEQAATLTHNWEEDVSYKRGRPAGELVNIVKVLDKASFWSVRGFIIIAVGALLQIVGSWPLN